MQLGFRVCSSEVSGSEMLRFVDLGSACWCSGDSGGLSV